MKKIVSVLVAVFMSIVSIGAYAFPDVGDSHWAYDYINSLAEDEILNGYPDGTFCPDGDVTRAEFAKILDCSGFGDDEVQQIPFADIKDHWARDFVAHTQNLIYTSGEYYFPDREATREEIAYAYVNVLAKHGHVSELSDSKLSALNSFTDIKDISEGFEDALAVAVSIGLIEGYPDSTLRPDGKVTRAELAALAVRTFEMIAEYEEVPSENSGIVEDATKEEAESDNLDEKEPSKNDGGKLPVFPEGTDHIYTLYPARHIILVSSVTRVIDDDSGEEAYKLAYVLADDEEDTVYTSVLVEKDDMTVTGIRSSLDDIKAGDILITDTAIYGRISTVFVFATYGDGMPLPGEVKIPSSKKLGPLGSGTDYEFAAGKVTEVKSKSKSLVLTVENINGTENLTVSREASVKLFESRKKQPWIGDSVSGIDVDMYVFVRYTNGRATEVMICE